MGNKGCDNSVLFQPYDFAHDYNDNPMDSYELFTAEAFDKNIFVIDCVIDKFKKVLVVEDRENGLIIFNDKWDTIY